MNDFHRTVDEIRLVKWHVRHYTLGHVPSRVAGLHNTRGPIMTPELLPILLPIPLACRYIGIARSRLYLEIKAGTLDARKIGRRTVITRASLDAFLANLPKIR